MGRPRTDIKTRVLHSARVRFLADGVDGASLRLIAKDAGTSIGMVFYYYPTKDALFLDVIEEVYAKLLVDLEEHLGGTAPLRERLEAVFTRIGRASPEEMDVIRLVVREALVSSPRLGQVLARFQRGHVGLAMNALAGGAERGEVDPTIPLPLALIATFAMGAIPQVARRIAPPGVPFSQLPEPEELAKAAVGVLFGGIGAKNASAVLTTGDRGNDSTSPARSTPTKKSAPKTKARRS